MKGKENSRLTAWGELSAASAPCPKGEIAVMEPRVEGGKSALHAKSHTKVRQGAGEGMMRVLCV